MLLVTIVTCLAMCLLGHCLTIPAYNTRCTSGSISHVNAGSKTGQWPGRE